MIRNLKVLGLALMALIAFGALSASGASAEDTQGILTTEGGKDVTLDVTETGGTFDNSWTAFGSSIHCPGTTYTGHKALTHAETTAQKTHELIPDKSTTVTITPHYAQANCKDAHGRTMTIDTNGCDFVFHLGKTTVVNEVQKYGVTADVVCPNPADGIITTVWATGNNHGQTPLCTIEVTGGELNQGLTGAHIRNTPASEGTKNDLDITGTFHSIHAERTGLCVFDGQGTTTNSTVLHIDATIKGTDSLGNDLGITVSDKRA